jgi:hypothetical protein
MPVAAGNLNLDPDKGYGFATLINVDGASATSLA